MSKGDFNVEEPVYSDVPEENVDNETSDKKNSQDLYQQDYGEYSDFSNIGLSENGSYIENADVVFEEKKNQTPEEKVKYFLSTINKKIVVVLAAILIIAVLILIIVFNFISDRNNSYYSEILIPNVIYMGETGGIEVLARGENIESLNDTINTFESKNLDIVTFAESELTGSDVYGTLIPIQEGRATVSVKSKLGNREMASMEKEIVVCPAFNNSLLLTEKISVVKGKSYEFVIDFGEKECSTGIVYESSNDNIATVDKDGKVTGVNVGKAILTVKKANRVISVEVEVTNESIAMTSFNVIPEKIQMVPGENIRLKIGYAPVNATSASIKFVNYNDSVAMVSDGGLVTAFKPGTTKVKVYQLENPSLSKTVDIVVSEKVSSTGDAVTEMTLDKTDVTMVQGDSVKILATVTPDTAKDKKITWKSSDENVAVVNDKGVIFAKSAGTANISASTSNNISRTVNVVVTNMTNPVIGASDGINSNLWHNKPYVLKFSGSESGVTYYYGKSENAMTNKGSKITLSNDEVATYYVKACRNEVCSGTVNYISKLDVTKPKVFSVVGIDSSATSEDRVQIAMKDGTSMIQRWCVTTVDNASTCNWTTIKTMANPVVSYVAKYNAIYYVFAKDTAGNISDSYQFQITNIE